MLLGFGEKGKSIWIMEQHKDALIDDLREGETIIWAYGTLIYIFPTQIRLGN